MSTENPKPRTLFDELKPGDRIEVERTEAVGREIRTTGTVVRLEHRQHGVPVEKCDIAEKACTDVILLALPDGELTRVTMDESTVLRRA